MHRKIKSYVLRAGRVSNRQQQGLDLWLADYELPTDKSTWDFAREFKRTADTVVEIGFGMGTSLATMAQQNPNINYIGIEVHKAGTGYYKTTTKNPRNHPEKMELMMYDPRVRKHVLFKEKKVK